jgi:hypothetical protein
MKKKPLLIQLDETDREKIERLSVVWGLSLAGTMRRLVKEYKENV